MLTPGIYNSAYFEHAFLADQMGAELVEGSDLRSSTGGMPCARRSGYERVDVHLSPHRRRLSRSADLQAGLELLGVPGIFDVYRAGGITLANAPGTGIADDKAIYTFMPEIIEFYTGEKPLLHNVPT